MSLDNRSTKLSYLSLVWLKRSLTGSYHHLSAKHLPAYLDEIE